MSTPYIKIANRKIGEGFPCFIVAEISANHCQNYSKAVKLIKEAAKCGVDAVKLQTYTPDTITINSNNKWFRVVGKNTPRQWKNQNLYQLYEKAYTPWDWQPKLKKIAEQLGLIFFSSPFDESAVDFLEKIGVPCYKVASYEANHIPLLKKIALTKKPVIMSVGFSKLDEIEYAIKSLKKYGSKQIAILHCVTSYSNDPPFENIHLLTIRDIRYRFKVVSGFSDNNSGIDIPIAAVLSGASIIEKHFILNRTENSPDAQFSIEPSEMQLMVKRIRRLEKLMGNVYYGPKNEAESHNRLYLRSVFSVVDIKIGQKFTSDNIRIIRPANGLAPRFMADIIGKTASKNIRRGTPISWRLIKKR